MANAEHLTDIEKNPIAKYVFWGPDGAFDGTEMVLSPAMAHKARFILSTFTVSGFKKDKSGAIVVKVEQNEGEGAVTHYGDAGSAKEKLLNSQNQF